MVNILCFHNRDMILLPLEIKSWTRVSPNVQIIGHTRVGFMFCYSEPSYMLGKFMGRPIILAEESSDGVFSAGWLVRLEISIREIWA